MWPFKKKVPRIFKWRFKATMSEVATALDEQKAEKQLLNLSPEERKFFKQLMKVWCKRGRSC